MDARGAESLLAVAEKTSVGVIGPNARASLDRLDEELGGLEHALSWFVDGGRMDEALRLANSLYRFWITKQRFDEGAAWFDRVLATPGRRRSSPR
jgi:predicted ATPase